MGIDPHISLDTRILLDPINSKFGLTYHHRFGFGPMEISGRLTSRLALAVWGFIPAW